MKRLETAMHCLSWAPILPNVLLGYELIGGASQTIHASTLDCRRVDDLLDMIAAIQTAPIYQDAPITFLEAE